MNNFMAVVDAILNTSTPNEVFAGQPAVNNFTAGLSSGNAERTAARLRTLGIILPTTAPLIRTDLPPHLILIDHPNGLLGGEPRERSHAWWESGLDLRELVRGPEYVDPGEFVLTRQRMEQAFRLLQPFWSVPSRPLGNPFVSITGACT